MKKAKKQSTAGASGNCQWQDKKFNIKCLEGHNDQIFSVDMDGSLLISGRFVYFSNQQFVNPPLRIFEIKL